VHSQRKTKFEAAVAAEGQNQNQNRAINEAATTKTMPNNDIKVVGGAFWLQKQ